VAPKTSLSSGGAVASAAAPPAELMKVKLAIPSPTLTAFAVYTANDQGFFKQHGLDVTVIQVAVSATLAALQAGEVQFTTSTGSATRGAVQGLPVRVLGYFGYGPFSLLSKADVTSMAQLKGKRVDLGTQGGDNYLFGLAALKQGGLAPADVQLAYSPSSDQTAKGLLAGTFDAGVVSPPNSQLLAEQGFHVLASPETSKRPGSGLATSLDVIQKQPQLIRPVLEAVLDAVAWCKANPDLATAYFAQKFALPPSVARAAYDEEMAMRHYTFTDEELQQIVDRALADANSTKKLAVGDVFNVSLLRELVHAKGLDT
jgi:NitT/TauT family transport system substrate-binding protein